MTNTTTVQSPFGEITIVLQSATTGYATAECVRVNGKDHKLSMHFMAATSYGDDGKGKGTQYVRGDYSNGVTLSRIGEGYNSGTQNAKNKISEFVFAEAAKLLFSKDGAAAGNAAKIANLLEYAQKDVIAAEEALVNAKARLAEVKAQAKVNGPFCAVIEQYGQGKSCIRPQGHTGNHQTK